jgi:hypothetical protein
LAGKSFILGLFNEIVLHKFVNSSSESNNIVMNRFPIWIALLPFVMDVNRVCGKCVVRNDEELTTDFPRSFTESEEDENGCATRPPCVPSVFGSLVVQFLDLEMSFNSFQLYYDAVNKRVAKYGLPDNISELLLPSGPDKSSPKSYDFYRFDGEACELLVVDGLDVDVLCVPDAANLTATLRVGASSLPLWTLTETGLLGEFLFDGSTGFPIMIRIVTQSENDNMVNYYSNFVAEVDPKKFDVPPYCNDVPPAAASPDAIRRQLKLPGKYRNYNCAVLTKCNAFCFFFWMIWL